MSEYKIKGIDIKVGQVVSLLIMSGGFRYDIILSVKSINWKNGSKAKLELMGRAQYKCHGSKDPYASMESITIVSDTIEEIYSIKASSPDIRETELMLVKALFEEEYRNIVAKANNKGVKIQSNLFSASIKDDFTPLDSIAKFRSQIFGRIENIIDIKEQEKQVLLEKQKKEKEDLECTIEKRKTFRVNKKSGGARQRFRKKNRKLKKASFRIKPLSYNHIYNTGTITSTQSFSGSSFTITTAGTI